MQWQTPNGEKLTEVKDKLDFPFSQFHSNILSDVEILTHLYVVMYVYEECKQFRAPMV